MKIFFLSLVLIGFSGCVSKEPAPSNIEKYNEIMDKMEMPLHVKIEHEIKYKKDINSTVTLTEPTIMQSLMISNVDADNNQISDRFINTVLEYGSWDTEPNTKYKKGL